MALINFQKQFADDVRSGKKRQTIRAPRKYPIKAGETLYLYTGLRTKNTEKLVEVECKSVDEIYISRAGLATIKNDGEVVSLPYVEFQEDFAKADGFDSWKDMRKWFSDTHGLPFTGILIKW